LLSHRCFLLEGADLFAILQKSDEEGDAADDGGEKEKPKKAPASKSRPKVHIPNI
jgi:hypothetical protein